MLDLMRKHARNWLMKALLGIIIIVFIFYFGSIGGKKKAETVAVIDNKAIAYADIAKEYNNLINIYRQQLGGTLSDEVIKQLNLKQAALDNLLQQAIVIQKAREMRLMVSDEEVRSSILAIPAFRRGGGFDEKIYQQALRYNKLTPEDFERTQKDALITSRFLNLIQDGVKVSDQDVHDLYRFQKEKVNIHYLQISPDVFRTKVTLQEKDLEAYLKEHGQTFRVPDQIQVKYLTFRGEDFVSSVNVTEAEIKDYYDRRADQFKKGSGKPAALPEVKTKIMAEIRQIGGMQAAAEAAKKAHDAIYQDENFDGYAIKNRLTVGTTGLFPVGTPLPGTLSRIDDAASALTGLQKDEISKVLYDQNAYYLFKVIARRPAYTPTLKEIRDQVEKRVIDQEADRLAKKEAETVLAALRQGKPLAAVAAENKLPVLETGFFVTGAGTPKLGGSRDLNMAVFLLNEKKPNPDRVFNANGHYLVLQLKEREKLDDADFAANRENLKKALLQARRNDAVQVWLDGTKATMIKEGRLKINQDLKDL